jgi:hypothetical protein
MLSIMQHQTFQGISHERCQQQQAQLDEFAIWQTTTAFGSATIGAPPPKMPI